MNLTIVSLIFGLIGSGLFIASCFSIKRNNILILGMSSSIVLILGYFFKSDVTAAIMVFTALLRNILFTIEQYVNHPLMTRRTIALSMLPIILIAWFLTINVSNFEIYQLLILFCPILMIIGFSFQNIKLLKIFTIANGIGWVSYELITGAYGVILGEIVGILMAVIALWRIQQLENKSDNPKELIQSL